MEKEKDEGKKWYEVYFKNSTSTGLFTTKHPVEVEDGEVKLMLDDGRKYALSFGANEVIKVSVIEIPRYSAVALNVDNVVDKHRTSKPVERLEWGGEAYVPIETLPSALKLYKVTNPHFNFEVYVYTNYTPVTFNSELAITTSSAMYVVPLSLPVEMIKRVEVDEYENVEVVWVDELISEYETGDE